MKGYSRVVKYEGKSFRYNRNDAMLQIVAKASKDEIQEESEWLKDHKRPLYDIDADGYLVLYEEGLCRENWDDKESREYYMSLLLDEYRDEMYWLESSYREFG